MLKVATNKLGSLFISLLIVYVVTKQLGVDEYGKFVVLTSILATLNFLELGVQSYLKNELPIILEENKLENVAQIVVSGIFVTCIPVALFMILFVCFSGSLSPVFIEEKWSTLLMLFVFVVYTVKGVYVGLGENLLLQKAEFQSKLVSFFLVIVLLLTDESRVTVFVFTIYLPLVLAYVCYLRKIASRLRFDLKDVNFQASFFEAWNLLKSSFHYFEIGLVMLLILGMFPMILERLFNLRVAGAFGLYFKFYFIVVQVFKALASDIWFSLRSSWSSRNSEDFSNEVRKGKVLLLGFVITEMLLSSVLYYLIPKVFGVEFISLSWLTFCCVLSVLFMIYSIYGYFLNSIDVFNIQRYVSYVGSFIVILSVLLVHVFSANLAVFQLIIIGTMVLITSVYVYVFEKKKYLLFA